MDYVSQRNFSKIFFFLINYIALHPHTLRDFDLYDCKNIEKN